MVWSLSRTRWDVKTKQVLGSMFTKGTVWSGRSRRQGPCLTWPHSEANIGLSAAALRRVGGAVRSRAGGSQGLHGSPGPLAREGVRRCVHWASGPRRSGSDGDLSFLLLRHLFKVGACQWQPGFTACALPQWQSSPFVFYHLPSKGGI